VMRLSIVCLALILAPISASENTIQYECGDECDKKPMGSKDPHADSMPHTFGSFIPKSQSGLTKTMNAYLKDDPAHQEDALMVPHPQAVMPDVMITSDHGPNCIEPETAVVPTAGDVVPLNARIPYVTPEDKPALRRPCNLDEIMDLLRSIKNSMQNEDTHDAKLHAAVADGMSPVSAAQVHLRESEDEMTRLIAAKKANETLTNVMETIKIKSQLQEEMMNEKALLIKEEGTLKAPIIKAIGRTNINLQSAISAKQGALNDFAQHPSLTKEEVTQLLTTYDELIISIKKQLAGLHKEANDILTPIQLKINQTDHTILQVGTEIGELKKEQELLVPVAEKFTPAALTTADLVHADVLSHFNAERSAQDIDVSGFDQRSQDRSAIIHLVDEMLALVSDIQEPQDPNDQYVEVRQPVPLTGSVPQRASV